MINCKIFFQLIVTVFKENLTHSYALYLTVVLGLYLKQYLIRTSYREQVLSPSLMFLDL